jgi:hypothetical protein
LTRSPAPPRSAWLSARRYTLLQFEARATVACRPLLARLGVPASKQNLSRLDHEALFWRASAVGRPVTVDYASDMPGSGFSFPSPAARAAQRPATHVGDTGWNMRAAARCPRSPPPCSTSACSSAGFRQPSAQEALHELVPYARPPLISTEAAKATVEHRWLASRSSGGARRGRLAALPPLPSASPRAAQLGGSDGFHHNTALARSTGRLQPRTRGYREAKAIADRSSSISIPIW